MILAPDTLKPSAIALRNGMATRSAHALAVDAWSTYLAASRRFAIPISIGSPMTSSNTPRHLSVYLPAFCNGLAIGVYAGGAGTVQISTVDDDHYVYLPIEGDAVATVATAKYYLTGPRIAAADVTNDGWNRSVNVLPDAAPYTIQLQIDITDADPSTPVYAWTLCVIPDPFTGDLSAV